jgi:hypothetical protein
MPRLDAREWIDPLSYQHRYESAVKLGLTEELARDFAESSVPVWKLRDLVEHGCEPELALRILS